METEMNTIPTHYSPYLTLDKYPRFGDYLNTSKISHSWFCKYLILVLYFRQKIGYKVDETEAFYKDINKIDHLVFEHMNNEELKELLQCSICLAVAEIMDQKDIDCEHKQSIIKVLVAYNIP